ncbi:hypothetical protein ACFWGI_08250 [Streptomyces niveus]|uniref:hypothetical protein n=1 Tax=Streptomyces niveus TaxID=193462 RepID=UPI00364EBC10
MRQRERTDVVRLKAFRREAVLPHTVEGRLVLEALGEADRLRNARIVGYSTRRCRPLHPQGLPRGG